MFNSVFCRSSVVLICVTRISYLRQSKTSSNRPTSSPNRPQSDRLLAIRLMTLLCLIMDRHGLICCRFSFGLFSVARIAYLSQTPNRLQTDSEPFDHKPIGVLLILWSNVSFSVRFDVGLACVTGETHLGHATQPSPNRPIVGHLG